MLEMCAVCRRCVMYVGDGVLYVGDVCCMWEMCAVCRRCVMYVGDVCCMWEMCAVRFVLRVLDVCYHV